MHAAELAYRAIAENSADIVEIGRAWDFRNWHNSRSYPVPLYETRVVKRHPKMSLLVSSLFALNVLSLYASMVPQNKVARNCSLYSNPISIYSRYQSEYEFVDFLLFWFVFHHLNNISSLQYEYSKI